MKNNPTFRFIFFILLISNNVWSGSIDLSIEFNPWSFNGLSAGDVRAFSVTVTNNGSDDAGIDSVIPYPVSIDTEIMNLDETNFVVFVLNQDIAQDCFLIQSIYDPLPGNPAALVYSFYTPVIEAGQSITCYGLHQISADIDSRTIEWSTFSIGDVDTNPANDMALMRFSGHVTPVPSLSLFSLILLSLAVMLVASRFNLKTLKSGRNQGLIYHDVDGSS